MGLQQRESPAEVSNLPLLTNYEPPYLFLGDFTDPSTSPLLIKYSHPRGWRWDREEGGKELVE